MSGSATLAPRTGAIVRSFPARQKTDPLAILSRLEAAPGAVVAIPVFNGGEEARACILSVVNHTHGRRILVIDDGSSDTATVEMLAELSAAHGIEVVRNEENLGYTRTANRALELAGRDDVVLLNSDTEVGPLWLERLRWTAYSLSNAASASAISDNAGAMSMPVAGKANEWPAELGVDEIARHVSRSIPVNSLETPTAHGFCVYLRRDALDAIGGFDAESFPRGYGEENDWSMRALGAGMYHLVAPRVFVRHQQGATFGSSRDELIRRAREVVDALHPSYRPLVGQWMSSEAMTELRASFESALASARESDPRPRVMYVIHSSGGGTPETNRDLMNGLLDQQESYLLVVSERLARFERWRGGSAVVVAEWRPSEPFSLRDTWRADYATFVADIVMKHGIELIHIRHLINQPLTTVPEVARRLNVPVILSTHDFYYICPSVHLLDQNRVFCGGVCTPGAGPCTLPTPFTRGAPDLKHNWIEEWKRRASFVLGQSRAVIATTPSAARVYADNYPAHADKLTLIEHGRQLSPAWRELRDGRERRPGPLRVACPATWDPHKGTEYVQRLIELTGGRVEWHILGTGSTFAGEGAVVHGRYSRSGMRTLLDQIDPDFVGLFSIWPETYSHTLTEAWALGVPVIATDMGAVADRIRQHGGGELFGVDTPEDAAEFVLGKAAELAAGTLRSGAVPRRSIRSRLTMAQDYAALYRRVREGLERRTVGYVVRGEAGNHTGSTHVRLIRRVRSPRSRDFWFRAVDAADFVSGSDSARYDAMIVQRDAVPVGDVDEFVAICRARGIPLLLELDDDLLSDHARERLTAQGYDEKGLDALAALARAADRVIVSTEALAERVRPIASSVEVIPNELDTRLWGAADPSRPAEADAAEKDDELRVVYIGSATHGEDLELLRPVFDGLTTADGRRVRLAVVGVTEEDGDWFDRVPIPAGATGYPRFVRWLRGRAGQWVLGVAPLAGTEFNEAKSDLKFLEYTMLGLPVVASALRPYGGLDGTGLVTVPNDTASWRAAVLDALERPAGARERAGTAARYVLGERTIAGGEATARWLAILADTVHGQGGREAQE